MVPLSGTNIIKDLASFRAKSFSLSELDVGNLQATLPNLRPHTTSFQMGPPAGTCTMFCSNDLKSGEPLSKVRNLGSVYIVRGIVSRSGLVWTR